MSHRRSYKIKEFSSNVEGEVNRLRSQVDLFWPKEIRLYRLFGLEDGMRVLECGSGPGHVIENLLEECPGCMATAVEIDSYLVDVLKERMNGRCHISQQSIMDLGFASESFDFVITRLVLEHLPDPAGAVREVYRVLKPGGKAVFVDNDFEMHLKTYPDISELKDLYDAYCRSRVSEGGNPRIGRELPSILSKCGFVNVDLEIVCAHSSVTGDDMFLKSEGVGIPSRLVRGGYLSATVLDQLAVKWHRVLRHEHHSIFRQLFVSGGERAGRDALEKKGWKEQRALSSAEGPVSDPAEEPRAAGQTVFSVKPAERESVVKDYLQGHVADALSISRETIHDGMRVSDLGFDSLMAVEVISNIEFEMGVCLSLMDFFEGQSLRDIAVILYEKLFDKDSTDLSMVHLSRTEIPCDELNNNGIHAPGVEQDGSVGWEEGEI